MLSTYRHRTRHRTLAIGGSSRWSPDQQSSPSGPLSTRACVTVVTGQMGARAPSARRCEGDRPISAQRGPTAGESRMQHQPGDLGFGHPTELCAFRVRHDAQVANNVRHDRDVLPTAVVIHPLIDDSDRRGCDPGLFRCLTQGRLDRSLVTVPGSPGYSPGVPVTGPARPDAASEQRSGHPVSLRRSSRPAAPLTPQWRCPWLHRIQPLPSPCTRSPASHHVCSGVPDRAACWVGGPPSPGATRRGSP